MGSGGLYAPGAKLSNDASRTGIGAAEADVMNPKNAKLAATTKTFFFTERFMIITLQIAAT